MKCKYDPQFPPIPWVSIFIEAAVRALRRVHHEYLLFATEQQWGEPLNLAELNDNPGLAFADEPTVCSAISQEFLGSRLASGTHFAEVPNLITAGQRYFRIYREYLYPKSQERADFRIERIDPTTWKRFKRPAFIEAKRAFTRTTKLGDIPASAPKSQAAGAVSSIQVDIAKLIDHEKTEQVADDQARGCILVWNVTDPDYPATCVSPIEFLETVDRDMWLRAVRSVPLIVDEFANPALTGKAMVVRRWLWVALAEVTEPRAGELK